MINTSWEGMATQSIGGTRAAAPWPGQSSWVANMTHGPHKRPVRVLVVDDHADVRFLVRAILGDAGPDVAFAGEAAGAREAVEALESTDPDVVVLDARMPGIDGFEAAAMLLERRPGLPILLCSAIVDDEIRSRAGAAGIAACISKDQFEAIPEKALELAARG
jgi:CheY-like chemotaxis protein